MPVGEEKLHDDRLTENGIIPVDTEIFARYTMGDAGLQKDVIAIFRSHSRQYLSDLKYAADSKAWKMAAHTLKGTARTMGAKKLAALALEAEQEAVDISNGGHADLSLDRPGLVTLLTGIETELDRVNTFLTELSASLEKPDV